MIEFFYLCFVGAVVGWTVGAELAQPGYLSEGMRGIWAAYVHMFRFVTRNPR